MVKPWIDTESDGEAQIRAGEFWAAMRKDMDAGEFWADRAKRYCGQPATRLAVALENLPLPCAFTEAAVAVRALIRAKRRAKEPFDEELALLYWLAAIRSFMLEYAPRLREPGFNVVEAIPGRRLLALRYTYAELGYRDLGLLNKTDVRWLAESWGEPTSHTTLNALHKELWDEYEVKLIEERERADHDFRAQLRSLRATQTKRQDSHRDRSGSGCSIVIILAVVIASLSGAFCILL